MKLEVGQFVRTKKGIFQVRSDNTTIENKIEYVAVNGIYTHIDINTIIKSSHNIIDLVEVGDYVNGYKVEDITSVYDNNEEIITLHLASGSNYFQPNINDSKDIKTIVTKEMFSSMEYKVGE